MANREGFPMENDAELWRALNQSLADTARRMTVDMNRLFYPNGRDEAHERLSAMAGLDGSGSIIPIRH